MRGISLYGSPFLCSCAKRLAKSDIRGQTCARPMFLPEIEKLAMRLKVAPQFKLHIIAA
jgi:hypothetical protein